VLRRERIHGGSNLWLSFFPPCYFQVLESGQSFGSHLIPTLA
jgi:hypothetical protein